MGLFTDGFKLLKKASEPLYKTPKSIQETIEIMAVAENGIFEVSRNKYSKCYRFQDINYTTATEDEQIGIFERYCRFLNSLDCNYKITINNKNKNMEELRDKVLIAERNDGFNNYRRIYNEIIEEKIIEGRQGIEQERYLTITIERKNFEEAKAQFATLEATIHKAFIELGAEIVPLNGNERLKVLYDYYHLGDEGSFDFDIKAAKKVGADFKNDLCNGMVKYFPDHFEDESKYCKALFIKKYPSSLSDRFINEITSLPVHSITSIDVVPVPKDLTTKVLQKKYLGIESDIIKQQRVRNKNNDFSTEISYAKRTEKKEIEAIMDDVRENDQCLFFVGVTIILMAESKKELESVCETVETIGKRNSCTIDTHYLKQREALNTALPIGVRQVETMRTLLTQSLAVLMPFNVQELNDSTGNYYGINQISKNVNIGNRKKLINGNGRMLLPEDQGPHGRGIQEPDEPAEPDRGPDPRSEGHAGEKRLLPRHPDAGGCRQRGGERLLQGAACRPYPHLCRGEYPRRERRGDRRACAHHAEAHEVKRSRKFIGKDGNDGTISSDRNELRGLQCPRGKGRLQGAGCDVVQCEPADELHGR